MTLLIKFIIAFSVTGLAISLGFGFWSGNSLTHVLVTALICTILSAAIGAGVFQTLKSRVPEVLEIFEFSGAGSAEDVDVEEPASYAGESGLETEDIGADSIDAEPVATADESEGAGKAQNFGDHLLVENVKIKNEPKLMAQAIKTLLGKED